MKFETRQTSSNNFQQVATTHNMVCKRSQHVGPNNVASCWPTMLRAFARAFRLLKTNKAFGLDKISARLLKDSSPVYTTTFLTRYPFKFCPGA